MPVASCSVCPGTREIALLCCPPSKACRPLVARPVMMLSGSDWKSKVVDPSRTDGAGGGSDAVEKLTSRERSRPWIEDEGLLCRWHWAREREERQMPGPSDGCAALWEHPDPSRRRPSAPRPFHPAQNPGAPLAEACQEGHPSTARKRTGLA